MRRRTLVLSLGALLIAGSASAEDKPTLDQVRSLTLKAAALVAAEGIDKAKEVFHRPGEFRYGEIYVNVIAADGTWLIYPPNPRNEGKSVLNVRDADGKLLVQDIIAVALTKGEGWVEYRWLNPASNRIEPKSSFIRNVPERGAVVYIGLYR